MFQVILAEAPLDFVQGLDCFALFVRVVVKERFHDIEMDLQQLEVGQT